VSEEKDSPFLLASEAYDFALELHRIVEGTLTVVDVAVDLLSMARRACPEDPALALAAMRSRPIPSSRLPYSEVFGRLAKRLEEIGLVARSLGDVVQVKQPEAEAVRESPPSRAPQPEPPPPPAPRPPRRGKKESDR
jgi:hypothetical protein